MNKILDERYTILQKEMIYLLQKLDSYGYTREETINELNSENPDIVKETIIKYFDLKSRIDERKMCIEEIERIKDFAKDKEQGK